MRVRFSSEIQNRTKTAAEQPAVEPGGSTTIKRVRKARIPRLKKWAFVLVTWADAVSYRDEAHSDDAFPIAVRKSVGHFIKRTPEAISIAMEDDREHDGDVHDCQTVTSIPLGMIRKVTILVPVE